jgi:short-subunit dehydrogenase
MRGTDVKTIVITGASSGIGEALALHYAAPGIALGISGRDAKRLENVASACRAKGANVNAKAVDVADRTAMTAWLDEFPVINLLIANAGVGGGVGSEPIQKNLDGARSMFAINIDGVLNTIDPVLPSMAANGGGQIALMASLAGFRGMSTAPAYCASKGFVKLYGEGLRGALAKDNIKVNVICPGFVRSRITDQNNFSMPFFMEADRAAEIIAAGLTKNKARIAFPWPLLFSTWLLTVLPASLADILISRLPKKS